MVQLFIVFIYQVHMVQLFIVFIYQVHKTTGLPQVTDKLDHKNLYGVHIIMSGVRKNN
jgi:hypothetical protein